MDNHIYNDAWILDKWKTTFNWNKLCKMYNAEHNSNIGYNAFKSHCYKKLNLKLAYSKEQQQWLIENYPKLGREQTTKEFNIVFHENKTPGAIKMQCKKLGIHISDERRKEINKQISSKYYPIGTIVQKSHDEPYIKTDNGWIRLKEMHYKRSKKEVIIHLDRNPNNCNPDNLIVISQAISVKMSKNGFWSDNPEITRTGILWCQLDEALNKSGFKKPKLNIPEKKIPKPKKVRTIYLAPTSNTGELHIHKNKRDGMYRVTINKKYFYYNSSFKTLERAIEVRDMLLNGLKTKGEILT